MSFAAPLFSAFAAAAPFISTVGTIISGIGLLSSFGKDKQAANYQAMDTLQSASLFDMSSLQSGVQGLQEKVNLQESEARRQAAIRAKYAARGIMAEGSPETVMNDSLTVSRHQTQAAQFTYDTAATEQAMRGRMLKDAARNQRSAGLATATSNLITGGANLLQSVNRG